jgi:pseudouridine-5'-phosphate glycosidase
MENFLFDAIACLAKAGVDFVICGGVACILQGSNRNSFDLDISVDMNETHKCCQRETMGP